MAGTSFLLPYLGFGLDMGERGSFDYAMNWFRNENKLLENESTSADAGLKELEEASHRMTAAIVKSFPIPEFRIPAHPLTGEELKKGTELDFIQNNFAKLSGQKKAEALDEIMGPSCPGYKVKEHVFYLLGPFHDRKELLEGQRFQWVQGSVFADQVGGMVCKACGRTYQRTTHSSREPSPRCIGDGQAIRRHR